MKFPKRIRFRGKVLAVIYGKKENYAFYRVCAYVAGKRYMASFATYSEAKAHADKLAKDLAKGSVVAALSAGQARDAVGTIITNTACFTTLEVL